ncbi:hypothetical protein FRC01_011219 [Tulasnella sp. 417]|nr:hypothetical protein FRC01_011219 [Tulasnella sp. 417]
MSLSSCGENNSQATSLLSDSDMEPKPAQDADEEQIRKICDENDSQVTSLLWAMGLKRAKDADEEHPEDDQIRAICGENDSQATSFCSEVELKLAQSAGKELSTGDQVRDLRIKMAIGLYWGLDSTERSEMTEHLRVYREASESVSSLAVNIRILKTLIPVSKSLDTVLVAELNQHIQRLSEGLETVSVGLPMPHQALKQSYSPPLTASYLLASDSELIHKIDARYDERKIPRSG